MPAPSKPSLRSQKPLLHQRGAGSQASVIPPTVSASNGQRVLKRRRIDTQQPSPESDSSDHPTKKLKSETILRNRSTSKQSAIAAKRKTRAANLHSTLPTSGTLEKQPKANSLDSTTTNTRLIPSLATPPDSAAVRNTAVPIKARAVTAKVTGKRKRDDAPKAAAPKAPSVVITSLKKEEKRKLRSEDGGTRVKSDLALFFPDLMYELLSNEPRIEGTADPSGYFMTQC
jgi:hypothetical protein